MKKEKNNLISATDLKKKLNNKKIKILDARWFLEDSQKGKKLYDKQHIPQAIFFDINNNSASFSILAYYKISKYWTTNNFIKTSFSINTLIFKCFEVC